MPAIVAAVVVACLPGVHMPQLPRDVQQQIIARAARAHGVSPRVLYGIYGAESSFGKAQSSFGLTGDYPGVGTSGNFRKDANRSAQILSRLIHQTGSLEGALRKYSGGSYGAGHINDVLRGQSFNPPAGGGGGGATTTTTTTTTPAVDNSAQRLGLMQQLFKQHGGQKFQTLVALRSLAPDQPATTTRVSTGGTSLGMSGGSIQFAPGAKLIEPLGPPLSPTPPVDAVLVTAGLSAGRSRSATSVWNF